MAAEIFRVLMVCAANQCRSPLAEHMLRHSLDPLELAWIVNSAGVQAHTGNQMHPLTAKVLSSRGIWVDDWTTRRLTADMVEGADLILTAEAAHRSAVVTMCPPALQRTFPLLQFARLTSHVGHVHGTESRNRGSLLLERALGARDKLQSVDPSDDDIEDPIGRRASKFRRCADTIAAALNSILLPVQGVDD